MIQTPSSTASDGGGIGAPASSLAGAKKSEPAGALAMPHGSSRVLIIEDDRDLNNLLRFTLESTGQCEADSAFESTGALDKIRASKPHLLILDVMIPGPTDGLGLLRAIRDSEDFAELPVILLTAKNQEHDRILGFECGADDYISKPFSPKELLLRVHALLRRSGAVTALSPSGSPLDHTARSPSEVPETSAEPVLSVGPISIYPELFRVTVDDEAVTLTSTEYQLLCFLAERAGRLQSRSALLQKVWGYEGKVNTRTVDTHVKRLRQKLGQHGGMIETVHGFGYQLSTRPSLASGGSNDTEASP
jgi:two-component system phosphate regulon response regulator PhoB